MVILMRFDIYHVYVHISYSLKIVCSINLQLQGRMFDDKGFVYFFNSLCPTYPKNHIVPASITDEDIKSSAGFRALKRFPSVVWRYQQISCICPRNLSESLQNIAHVYHETKYCDTSLFFYL